MPHQIRTQFQADQLEEEMLRQNGGVHGYSLIRLAQRNKMMKNAKGFSEKKINEGAQNTLDIGYSSRLIKQRNESLENVKNLRDGHFDHDNS